MVRVTLSKRDLYTYLQSTHTHIYVYNIVPSVITRIKGPI